MRTPLVIAASRPGNASVVKLLLARGANPNPTLHPAAESSPLIEAATAADAPSMELLLARGADPNFANVDGQTALMPADDWIELKWAEARMTLRGARGKLHNYVAAAALRTERYHGSRVRRARGRELAADPTLRTSPPATVVVLDEAIGACYLFTQI